MFKSLLLSSVAGFISLSSTALAQTNNPDDTDASGPTLDTITVTATKRETTLADTALTVSVIDGDKIAEQGIFEVTELFNGVPGLGQNTSPGEFPAIKIRGIGTTNASQTLEQSVGLFLDGVYKPRARQYRDALFDVERVEVIKGAQGVVFGKNTNVGAISISARKPGDEFSGEISASYETEFDSYLVQGGIDLPLSDALKVRISGLVSERGGFVENTLTGETDGTQDRWTIRGIAQFEPTNNFDATLLVQHSDQQTEGSSFQIVDNVLGLPSFIIDDTPFERAVDGATIVGGTAFPADGDEQDSTDIALTLNFNLSDRVKVTSITSYSEFEFENAIDIFLTPFTPGVNGLGFIQFNEDFDQFTQEIRIDYQGDKTRVLAGGFFQTQNLEFTTQVGLDFVLPASTPPSPVDGFNAGGNFQSILDQDLTNFSGFIQVAHDFTERLTIEGGIRIADEDKTADFLRQTLFADNLGLIPVIPGLTPLPDGVPISQLSISPITTPDVPVFTDDIDDTTFDGSVTISYDLTDNWLGHVSFSQGTKSGAFNNQIQAAVDFLTGGVDVFGFIIEPEVARTVEVGFKGTFGSGRGYLAATGFYTDVNNFQESFFNPDIPPVGALVAGNVDARSVGFEAEGRFALTDAITLNGTIAYLDAENTDDNTRLAVAPEFTSSWGIDYEDSLTSSLNLRLGASAFTNSGFLHLPTPAGSAPIETGAFFLLDSYIGLTHVGTGLTARLDVKNITNEVYTTFGSPGVFPSTQGTFNRPRTFRFSLTAAF